MQYLPNTLYIIVAITKGQPLRNYTEFLLQIFINFPINTQKCFSPIQEIREIISEMLAQEETPQS